MVSIVAAILIGTGLFLLGMDMIESKLKQMAGRRLRLLLEKWTSNKLFSMLFGFVSGAVTHSGSSASLIITNLVKGRLLNIESALPILAAANVGTVMIVFLFAINIKLGVMYLLGITAILYSLNKNAKKAPLMGIILGISLTLYGFNNLETGAEHLIEIPYIHHFLESLHGSQFFLLLLFILGFSLRLITQSTSTVSILAITLGEIGILNFEQAAFVVFGAPLGAGLAMLFESKHFKGASRQIPVYQILFEVSGSLLALLLFSIEGLTSIPLLKSMLTSFLSHSAGQVAFTLLFVRLLPFAIFILVNNRLVALLQRLCPPVKEEILSAPGYIYDQALEDPETAMDLIEKEQLRLFDRFTVYVENVRKEHELDDITEYQVLHKASSKLSSEIDNFIKEMFEENLSRNSSQNLLKLQSIQDIIELLSDSVFQLVDEVAKNELNEDLQQLQDNIVESLHAVLSICISAAQSDSPDDINHVLNMTSDKGNLMETIREKYLSKLNGTSSANEKSIMYVSDLYSRIIWLLNKWAKLRV